MSVTLVADITALMEMLARQKGLEVNDKNRDAFVKDLKAWTEGAKSGAPGLGSIMHPQAPFGLPREGLPNMGSFRMKPMEFDKEKLRILKERYKRGDFPSPEELGIAP
jgi:hypothetical protein